MPQPTSVPLFRQQVDQEMLRLFGISWADACGDAEPLERAIDRGSSPREFALWWGDRYDLERVDTPHS